MTTPTTSSIEDTNPSTTQWMKDTDWQKCPLCKSGQIQGGSIEIEGEEAWQEVHCLTCSATWGEVYVASRRINIESKETMFKVSFRYYTDNENLSPIHLGNSMQDTLNNEYDGRVELLTVEAT